MPPPGDLLRHLRAADELLSAVAPGPHLEAQLRARLRGHTPSSRGPFGGRRIGRPLILAFAVAAIALMFFAGRARPAHDPDAMASSPSAAPSAIPERIHADGGPPDLLESPLLNHPPRPIHAPALKDVPVRRDRDSMPARPFTTPANAPEAPRPPDPPSLDPGSGWPAPPPRSDLVDAPLSPVLAGAPLAPMLPTYAHQSLSHDAPPRSSTPSSSPAPAGPEGEDPNAGCKSPDDTSAGCMEESKPDPKPNECTGGDFGDGKTCQEYAALPPKDQLLEVCTQAGLQLQEISITTDGCPNGQWSAASYKCCPPPTPPPPSECSEAELGDGKTCQDYVVLKQQSAELCQKAGGTLVDLASSSHGCPDGQWSLATYKCCGPGPTPADPCTYGKIGDGSTCQDAGALTQEAADTCAAAGLFTQATKLAYDCPGSQSTWAEIACCPLP
jgi:hypothetical protein